MTPKEKAQEIRDKFYFETSISELEEANECALIVVNEILNNDYPQFKFESDIEYWKEVKKEILKL